MPCASKLTANRQTGQMGSRPHPLAKCICGRKGRGPAPRRSAASIGAATTADQQAGVQILKRCNHSHSEFLCSFWKFFFKCFPVIIAAQALLRSSISAATQLFWRCYHGRISRGGSEKGKECGLGARAARSTRRKTQKMQTKCACVSSHHGFNVIFEIESSDVKRAHACSAYLHTFRF